MSAKLRMDDEAGVVQMGAVKGNTAIQLGAFLGIISRHALRVAFLHSGENGFFQGINLCRDTDTDLTTEEALDELRAAQAEFKERGTCIYEHDGLNATNSETRRFETHPMKFQRFLLRSASITHNIVKPKPKKKVQETVVMVDFFLALLKYCKI